MHFSGLKSIFSLSFPLPAGNSDIRNASADRSPQYLLDVVDAGRQHDEAIEPERDPGAGGQPVLEGGEEVLVDRIGLAVELPLLRLVGDEPPALLGRIGQLAEGVGE